MHAGGAHIAPLGAGAHAPTLPGRSHATQEPAHAESQQTPCGAQKPDMQSPGALHGWPSARAPQLAPMQTDGGAQPFAGGVQLVAQAMALAQA